MGHVIKLLAIAESDGREVAVRVHPTMVPQNHPLASVRESFNAVFLEGAEVGDLMLYRRRRGGPTASAMLGDLISAARNLQQGVAGDMGSFSEVAIRAIDETTSAFYLQLDVEDQPGCWLPSPMSLANTGIDPLDGTTRPRRHCSPCIHNP